MARYDGVTSGVRGRYRYRSNRSLPSALKFTPLQVIGNKWDMYLDLLQAEYTEGYGTSVFYSHLLCYLPAALINSVWQGCPGRPWAAEILLQADADDTR